MKRFTVMLMASRGRVIRGLAVVTSLAIAAASRAEDVVVIRSSRLGPYLEAVQGARERLANVSILEIELSDRIDPRALRRKVEAAQARVVLAIGRAATEASLAMEGRVPIVYCMLLNPSEVASRSADLAGVHLQVPAAEQLRSLKGLLPHVSKVAILHDPVRSSDVVEQALAAAPALSLEVLSQPASSLKDVLPALRAAKQKGAEALLMVPDAAIYNKDSMDGILRFAIEQKMAFMASDKDIVRVGGLCALSPSFPGAGAQAADLVRAVLGGANVADLPIESPRDYRLHVNLRTADLIGAKLAPEALGTAAETYR